MKGILKRLFKVAGIFLIVFSNLAFLAVWLDEVDYERYYLHCTNSDKVVIVNRYISYRYVDDSAWKDCLVDLTEEQTLEFEQNSGYWFMHDNITLGLNQGYKLSYLYSNPEQKKILGDGAVKFDPEFNYTVEVKYSISEILTITYLVLLLYWYIIYGKEAKEKNFIIKFLKRKAR